MRLPLDWLAEWIDLPPRPELEDRLNLGRLRGRAGGGGRQDLSGVRVGQVLERASIPNADRLSVCRVDLGEGEPLEVVCGAPNVAGGQKVAVAVAGVRAARRYQAQAVEDPRGALARHDLLGPRARARGRPRRHPGARRGRARGRAARRGARGGRAVLEVGITPNRGDTASLLGLAREMRALFGGDVARCPRRSRRRAARPRAEAISVAIEAATAATTTSARVVRGVRVGPSPDWLVRRLEASGLRAINIVVDVTNLVLLEFGQPLHAFDLAHAAGRGDPRALREAGERLVTLDGQNRELAAGIW